MKITFPHMGNMYICVRALLEYLDLDVVVPPPTSKRTLTLGTAVAPEFACLPLKINLGNFIEARELGADTVIMAGGRGPCRFGYYAQIEKGILEDLGMELKMLVIEPPQKSVREFLQEIKDTAGGKSWWTIIRAIRFGWEKIKAVDEIEKEVMRLRAREEKTGVVDAVYREALQAVDRAGSYEELKGAVREAKERLAAVPLRKEEDDILRIGITGEIYTLLEPFANLDIERKLGRMGVEVERSIMLSEWIDEHLFLGLARHNHGHETKRAARPYINHFVGGHGQETLGSVNRYRQRGFDGVIQLMPFTCMPEIVAQSVLPRAREELDIPVLTLIVDEHTGEAGFITRLEAFVDLLRHRKERKREGKLVVPVGRA